MNISGEAAIVTGGGSGLGEATARALAASGARVTILDFNAEAGAAVAAAIGGRSAAIDVADAAAAEQACAEAAEAHGPARILVNCAGVAPAQRVLGREGVMPLADFERAVRVNLIGTFNLLRLVAAGAAELQPNDAGERAVIVNTASIAGYEGQIGQAAYAASKAGVIGLTLPAAREFAKIGVRVVSIAPGLFETPMLQGLPPAAQEALGGVTPFPSRLGKPAEFASLVQSVIGNPMLNGETIRLDGALRMAPK